jgi:hypothetical protein
MKILEMDGRRRWRFPQECFAYVDAEGNGHLPIHTPEYLRCSLDRFDKSFVPAADRLGVLRKLLDAASASEIDWHPYFAPLESFAPPQTADVAQASDPSTVTRRTRPKLQFDPFEVSIVRRRVPKKDTSSDPFAVTVRE